MHQHSSSTVQGQLPVTGPRRPALTTTGSSPVIGSVSSIRRPISDESWIEVASQPSSSSLSSATADEVITTGLRVTQSLNPRRRRRLHRSVSEQNPGLRARPTSGLASSQEEYDESDSEEDRIMTSSDEGLRTRGVDGGDGGFNRDEGESHDESVAAGEDSGSLISDDDGNATALGVGVAIAPSPSIFTPQPTAFSHPPSARTARTPADTANSSSQSSGSYFPPLPSSMREGSASTAATSTQTARPTVSRQMSSRTHVRSRSHTPYTLIAPNHTVPVDHDAALRASLSTLLSCAAAARGLPKRDSSGALLDSANGGSSAAGPPIPSRPAAANRIEQGSLRLVPESAMLDSSPGSSPTMATAPSPSTKQLQQPPSLPRRHRRQQSPHHHSGEEESASSMQQQQKRRRKSRSPSSSKKQHNTTARGFSSPNPASNYEENAVSSSVSPTLMTWVLGAGVMVLFSAISFSAGYALGKEVGRMEAAVGTGGTNGGGMLGCGGGVGDVDSFGRSLGTGAGAGMGMGMGIKGRSGWRWGNASGIRV